MSEIVKERDLEKVRRHVGRVVQYTNLGDRDGKYPPEVQAALITGLNADGTVSLHVFYRTGGFDMPSVSYTEEPAGTDGARGKWSSNGKIRMMGGV